MCIFTEAGFVEFFSTVLCPANKLQNLSPNELTRLHSIAGITVMVSRRIIKV
jgi:hypothetical protein